MSIVKYVMVTITLISFHRFMEPLENRELSMYTVPQKYVSTDAAGLMKGCTKKNPSLQ